MIRIYIDHLSEVQTWYANQMIPLIQSKHLHQTIQIKKDPLATSFFQRLDTLSESLIQDILISPPQELLKKYDWIQEYIMLCDVIALYPSFRKQYSGHNANNARAEYISRYHNSVFFRKAFEEADITDILAVKSWRNLNIVIQKAKAKRTLLDSIIKQKFDYSFLSNEIRGALVEKMYIPVCPYCNRQYIQPVTIDGKKRYLGDLDHFLPKSLYHLFSLSLWNLTPCCKVCNQIFKKNQGIRVLNPQVRGFDQDCLLVLEYKNARQIIGLEPPEKMKWVIQPSATPDTKSQIENHIHVFRLNEIYDYHRRDIQRILQRRYQQKSCGYNKSLRRLMKGSFLSDPSLWYGVSLDPTKFQDELLSKAIYDTIFYN